MRGTLPLRTEAEEVTQKFRKNDPQIWKNRPKRVPKSLKTDENGQKTAENNPIDTTMAAAVVQGSIWAWNGSEVVQTPVVI